jgi:hypothetical protein
MVVSFAEIADIYSPVIPDLLSNALKLVISKLTLILAPTPGQGAFPTELSVRELPFISLILAIPLEHASAVVLARFERTLINIAIF